jgi:16S rRNA (guanine527-N7)-methyltransferase
VEHPARMRAALDVYGRLVARYNDQLGLVAPGDLDHFATRHVADSLRAAPVLAEVGPGPVIDVGSGAGLPGVPLALADPKRFVRLLEPHRRRAAFLEEVVRLLDLNCEVVTRRAEDAARDPELRSVHAVAVARALAPPARALALLTPFVAAHGVALLFVGRGRPVPPGAEEWRPGLAIVRAQITAE